MSGSAKKLLHAAAGSASDDKVYVEDVFSTHLYTGNSSTRSIDNNIDLSGEGGLVWIKDRSAAEEHVLIDSERGASKGIRSNSNAAEHTDTSSLTSFDNDGFSLGTGYSYFSTNYTGRDYASWTFRKQEGFFDIVTYTGNGNTSKTINHNLNCKPGMMIIKMLTESGYAWRVWHKSVASSNGANYSLSLNNTTAAANGSSSAGGYWNHTAPTSTQFTVGNYGQTNNNGSSFVAYLFADGDESDAQIFGDDGDEAIVKCGTFTTWGIANAECGFEPQWLMYKRTDDTEDWQMIDNMRGCATKQGKWNGTDDSTQYSSVSTSNDQVLKANTTAAEVNEGRADFHSTGFSVATGGASDTYVYVAIRRGPMKEPDAGTDVFQSQTYTGDGSTREFALNITPDTVISLSRDENGDGRAINNRLLGQNEVYTEGTQAKYANGADGVFFDYTKKIKVQSYRDTNAEPYCNLLFKRYPKVFDVVVYQGNGSNSPYRTINHNLGVAPELVIIKNIDSSSTHWVLVLIRETLMLMAE